MNAVTLRVHAFLEASRANGPGLRAVLWLQGCDMGCPGCFNPETHDPAGGCTTSVDDLAQRILSLQSEIEGLTISGGEPFRQASGLHLLLKAVRAAGLSTLVFTGYRLEEIQNLPDGPETLQQIDVLVAGRYVRARANEAPSLFSGHKTLHCLTLRYSTADLTDLPSMEVQVDGMGNLIMTGTGVMDLGALVERRATEP